MPTDAEKQEYLNYLVEQRGYVLDSHKQMANYDLDVLKAFNTLVEEVNLKERRLDRRTKELILIASMTCMGAPSQFIENHVRIALDAGCEPEEILEAIEIILPEAGLPTFQHGLQAWAKTVNAQGIEPTVKLGQRKPIDSTD